MKVIVKIAFVGALVLGSWNSYELLQANKVIDHQQQNILDNAAKAAAVEEMVRELQAAAPGVPDSNVYTAKFATAYCAQDAQGVYDSLAPGSSPRAGLDGEADYYAQIVDDNTAWAAAIIAEAASASGTDATAILAALDVKAASLKAQNSPVAILAAEIKLSDGTTCAMTFKGSFTDRSGSYNAIYVVAYTRADGTTDGNFYVLTAGNGGVEDIQ